MLLLMNCKSKLLPDSYKANINPAQGVDRVILTWLLINISTTVSAFRIFFLFCFIEL